MLIVLSGMDGSGKSTISKELRSVLRKKYNKPIKQVDMRYHFFLEPLLRFVKRIKGIDPEKSTTNPLLTSGKKGLVSRIWPLAVILDDLLFYYLYIKPLSYFSVLVCDRFLHDRLVGFKYYGFISNNSFSLYLKFLPTPPAYFIFEVPPKIALEREQNEKHSLSFYTDIRDTYRELAKKKSIKIIDNTDKIDETIARMMALIYF